MFTYQVNFFVAETNLTDHRPSVIAAAAVLVAVDGQLSKKALELKTNVISLWGSQEKVSFFVTINFSHNAVDLVC